MPTAKARNADLTGRTRAADQQAHKQELAERAAELSTTAAAEAEARENEVIDYSTGGSVPVVLEVIDEPLEVTAEWKVIRTNEDIEDMTFGVGALYNFKAGQKTKVPAPVADHLEELGFVWH